MLNGAHAIIYSKKAEANLFGEVLPEDLHKFGLIPEFIGRLPVVTTVTPLDQAALMQILTEPRNALVRQYQRMFELDGVELEFETDALEAIASFTTYQNRTGDVKSLVDDPLLGGLRADPGVDDLDKP